MPRTLTIRPIMALALLVLAIPAGSQTPAGPATGLPAPSFGDIMSGKAFPLTVKLKDLSGEWRRMTIGGQFDGSNIMQMMMGGGGGASEAFYSRGDTVLIGGETFLVAYKSATKRMGMAELMQAQRGRPPAPEKLTPDTTLGFGLFNVRTVTSLTDVRPFNLQEELAASELAVAQAQKDMVAMVQAQGGAADTASTSNLKQLALGLHQYAQDNDGILPPLDDAAALKKALLPYVKSESLFASPAGVAYEANGTLSLRKLAEIKNPAEIAIFYEASAEADGKRAVAYLDGHVKRVTDDEWKLIRQVSQVPARQRPKPAQ